MTDPNVKLSVALQAIAGGVEAALEEIAGERILFALVIFGPEKQQGGAPKLMGQYAANITRDSAKRGLQELLERWDENPEDVPLHVKKSH